ncbi:hypothetical protein LA313_09370 [Salinimicrobium sp. ASW11-47]|nr:hypothetical protein [Salinimicrobium sediminilitoris]
MKKNPNITYASWISENDTARISRLIHPVFEQYVLAYPPFRNNLEKMTGKDFNDNTIFLLEYVYLDDHCTSKRNHWTKKDVMERKHFLDSITTEPLGQNDQLDFLHIFEKGIEFPKTSVPEKEYFHTDTNNFLRKTIFRNPTLCGSFALIKPNGQVLVRHGEFRADWMSEYLKKDYWDLIFPPRAEE